MTEWLPGKKRKRDNDGMSYRHARVEQGKVGVFFFFLCDDWVMTEMPYDLLLFLSFGFFLVFHRFTRSCSGT